jgi:hypothetical protein
MIDPAKKEQVTQSTRKRGGDMLTGVSKKAKKAKSNAKRSGDMLTGVSKKAKKAKSNEKSGDVEVTGVSKKAKEAKSKLAVVRKVLSSEVYNLTKEEKAYLLSSRVGEDDPGLMLVWEDDELEHVLGAVVANAIPNLQAPPPFIDVASPT